MLEYIRRSIDQVERYRSRRSGFGADDMAEDAILRWLETLSDAAGRLSDDLRARHAEIPWRRVIGFRNVLAHGYLGIDPDRIDDVIERDLPPLRAVVDEELGE